MIRDRGEWWVSDGKWQAGQAQGQAHSGLANLEVEALGVPRLELAVDLQLAPLHLGIVRAKVEGGLRGIARDL